MSRKRKMRKNTTLIRKKQIRYINTRTPINSDSKDKGHKILSYAILWLEHSLVHDVQGVNAMRVD
jgi:hypothetical protein